MVNRADILERNVIVSVRKKITKSGRKRRVWLGRILRCRASGKHLWKLESRAPLFEIGTLEL